MAMALAVFFRGEIQASRTCSEWHNRLDRDFVPALFSSPKILQNFSDSPSHRIFRRMHEVLNIDKNKN